METIINGQIRTLGNGQKIMEWEDPATDQEMSAQGDFYFNKSKNRYEHNVISEDGEILYTVIA